MNILDENILKAMRQNGSPPPALETDKDRTCFLVRLPIHPRFIKEAEERKRRAATGQITGQVAQRLTRRSAQHRRKFSPG